MKISVIDLGFNSLKLVIYDVNQNNGSFRVFDNESVPARLGEGLGQTGFLGAEPMRRAIEGLKFFKEINEFNGVKHSIPVATSAVREAANSEQFINQVLLETGFKFRVLSGREEALYSYAGAARSLGRSDILFFDIGGGSLEFVYAKDRKITKILSLPLGGLRLTQLFGEPDCSFKRKALDKMEERILELLPSRGELALREDATLVGVGGNLRALAKWDQELRRYPLLKLHNYTIKRESIELMAKELWQLSSAQIAEIDGIGRDRGKTLGAGAIVIEMILNKLGFKRLTVSTHGLRDGVLASFLDDPIAYHKGHLGKTLRKTLNSEIVQQPDRRITKFLDLLKTYDLINSREAEILIYALGWMEMEPSETPEGIFYLMMDDESFLSHKDQLIASLSIVEQNKPRSAKWLYERYSSMLKSKKNKETIEKIATVSRLLDIILRTDSKINLSILEKGSKIRLNIITQAKQHFPQRLFAYSVRDLGDKLDRFVEYSLRPALPKPEKLVPSRLEGS